MSLFKRIAATVYAQVDQTVSQIENHDAVIQSAIKQTQRAAAQTKVRLSRVHADGERMRRQLSALQDDSRQWRDRAKRAATSDRETALKCLARGKRCDDQITQLQQSLHKHGELSKRLEAEFNRVDSQLRQINDQRNLMRTRESAADALRMLNALDSGAGIDIEDAMDRWEVRVTEAEMQFSPSDFGAHNTKSDELDQAFSQVEQREALAAELDQLMAEDSNHG